MGDNDQYKIKTVVMSGGAPQSPLMAGFLYALWDKERTFSRFHTSGAGALMALLFLSPNKEKNPKLTPGVALESWCEAGVSDEIYRVLPQNYKLFHKPGPFAPVFTRLAERFKVPMDAPKESADPVSQVMREFLAALETYRSDATAALRKDPIEQIRDVWRAMWVGASSDPRADMLTKRDPIRRLRELWLASWFKEPDQRRLYNDMVDLWFSALTPSTLTSRSLGMAAPLPFLEDLVDFKGLPDKVKALGDGAHMCVNAYNMTLDAKERTRRKITGQNRSALDRCKDREDVRPDVMQLFSQPFDKDHPDPNQGNYPIDADGIRAAFSMPFIYPPARIGDDYFSEGADHEPINFRHVKQNKEYPFVLLDVLGELEDHLVRKPRDLWDSYVISIMTPVVALANEEISDMHDHLSAELGCGWNEKMLVVEWDIPMEDQAFVMDWSRSNMAKLFEVGKKAGYAFLDKHLDDLRPRPK